MAAPTEQNVFNILYSCTEARKRGLEQFVPDHALCCVLAGEIHFYTQEGTAVYKPGTIGLIRRNQLAKSLKVPAADGSPLKAISLMLPQEVLRQYSQQQGIDNISPYKGPGTCVLKEDVFIRRFFDSLEPYFNMPEALTEQLATIKTTEAIALLLRHDARLRDLLFDFQEPHKVDLAAFMNQHFMFNVTMSRFATLTGRSLATFKRDFQKEFATSPEKWLLRKRLEHAHYLLAHKQQRPSDVYLEVGFENLSHFSTSFKQLYGYSPSNVP